MKKRGGIHVGVSSLLLIFLVLALVSFAVLSLASASSDLKLSRRYAERTSGYYNACAQAQDFIAEADRNAASGGGTETLTADFPVSETQYLHVELESANRITCWRLVTDEDALALDESLPVLP